jgi:tetratricopeptide (TPR) repeat protein
MDARQPPPTMDVEYLKHEIPSEAQLVLLSLDYLRDLSRAYANPKDLLDAEGMHSDWLTLAIYALKRSFANPVSLAKQNDAWKEPEGLPYAASSVDISKLPSMEAMTREVSYPENPHDDEEEVGRPYDKDLESYAWYDYDDSNPANAHRFYAMNGLASGSAGPLLMGEIAAAGLAHMQARSRQAAEQEMVASPLFEQFVETVKSKGFFDTGNDIPRDDPMEEQERRLRKKQLYNERYLKTVAKFRSKLASKAQAEDPETTLADHHHSRRMRRCLAVRKERANKNNETAPDVNSVVTNLSKKIDSFGPKSPSRSNPADLDEAETLKALGNAYMQKKDYEAAADVYTQALKLSPSGPSSHVYFSNRAAALLSMKKFSDAIMDSERALALKPNYSKAHARLGLAHYLLGDYRQAMEAYSVALKYEPNNKSSKSYLEKAARRLAAGDDQQTQASGLNGSSFSVVSEWDNSPKGGKTSFVPTEEKIRDQKEAEKFKIRGNSLMASREYALALDAYSIAIKLNQDGPQSHVYFANRSAALCYLERYHEAARDAEKGLRLRPTYAKAHARLGLARFFMNDFEGAVKAYKAALEFDPDNAAAKSYLAKAQLKLEKQKEEEAPVPIGKDARRLLSDPDMILMAKKAMSKNSSSNLMDDPEMMTIAKKATSNATMMDAMMAAQRIHQA